MPICEKVKKGVRTIKEKSKKLVKMYLNKSFKFYLDLGLSLW